MQWRFFNIFQDRGKWQSDQYIGVALLICKTDTVVVCRWATKGNRGGKYLDFVQIACIKTTGARVTWRMGSIWSLAGNGRHRLLADLVLTTTLGLHLVYIWSTPDLHAAAMSNDYTLCMNTKPPKTTLVTAGCRYLFLQN